MFSVFYLPLHLYLDRCLLLAFSLKMADCCKRCCVVPGCRYTFRLQLFRRRGVNLLLLYNLFFSVVYSFGVAQAANVPHYATSIVHVIGVCLFPVAGFLADIRYSRYKVIKVSMWLIWMTVVIQSGVAIVFYTRGMCANNEGSLCKGVAIFLQVLLTLGQAGFLSNIIQFSMDQFQEAPTAEITSFIVWYMWTGSFGIALAAIHNSCLCGIYKLVATLFFPMIFSLALCLDSFVSHWLVRDPVSHQNPYKMFFGVLRYAVKNKYPRLRSAFTYWEDKPYSRIDLAKDKYGGPFTTEQVEDVKIVLRILAMLTIACFGACLSNTLGGSYDAKVFHQLAGKDASTSSQYCSIEAVQSCVHLLAVKYSRLFAFFFFVPVHELVIYPLIRNYVAQMNSVAKFILGLLLLVLHYIALMIIEAVGFTDFPNKGKTCFLNKNNNQLLLNIKWYCVPELLRGISLLYIVWGCIEFICSQAPHNMKGLIFGLGYFLLGFFTLFANLLLLPVSLTVESWHPVPYGCGVWFYLCVTVFFLIFTLVCIIVFKKVYKMRRRDEDLHNRHIFAINYYSHYVQYNREMGTDNDTQ